jgi:UPF0755 protein
VIAAACAGVAAAAMAYTMWRGLHAPLALPDNGLVFEVQAGTPLSRISRDLAAAGVVRDARALTWYGRLTGEATRVHAGEYRIDPGLSALDLLAKLVAGQVVLHQFTIIEGWRFEDLLGALRGHPAVTAGTATTGEIMTALGKPELHPEGQFLPDTYTFPRGTTELRLLTLAHAALEEALDKAWSRRATNLAIEDRYEALVLASIIEKETAVPAERRTISGVFHRRLRANMRLQTDPTVIYGMGEAYDGNLRRGDLSRDTPYNTYTRRGLPPTPIALPGAASIEAAVMPEDGDALYFVATGDPDGSHRFSATLEEHNRAVRDYVQRQREGR